MATITALQLLLYSASTITSLVIGAITVFAILRSRLNRKYGHLPSPRGASFFLGHLAPVKNVKNNTGIPLLSQFYQWHRELGPVFYCRFLLQHMIICSNAKTVKQVVLDSRHKKPTEMYDFFYSVFGERFMGRGLVSEIDHEKWRIKRALMNPAFHRRYLMFMMEQFNQTSDSLCQTLSPMADDKTLVPMLDSFNNVTLDVIGKVGFNLDLNALTTPDCPFPNAVALTLQGMNKLFENPSLLLDPRQKARQYRKDVRDACKLIRRCGQECIEERIKAKERGDELPNDILTLLLKTGDDLGGDQAYGIREMVDEFATFFMAGQETTSNLLAFTLIQIGRHEQVARRLREEVDNVLGQKPFVEYADLAKLDYMTRVFKETMRLYPPVSGLTRELAFDIESGGHTIPKGAIILFLSYLTGRSDEYWDDPLLFNPDRFIPTDQVPKHLYAYFPFSLGQRNCIGQQLAMIESKVILGKLLQRFNFRFEQAQRLGIRDEVTNKPLDNCKNYLSLRD